MGKVAFLIAGLVLVSVLSTGWEGTPRRTSDQDYCTVLSPTTCGFNRTNEWGDIVPTNNFSDQLVIGIEPDRFTDFMDLIKRSGGTFIDEISMGKEVTAVVVDVPFGSSLVAEAKASGMSRYVEPRVRFRMDLVPNDPYWNLQWGTNKIGAPYAWNKTLGDKTVLVVVVDTGIDYNHSDLAANYVPYGADFANNDNDPMDDHGHGTHVAGIIAATVNNKLGMAGLAQVGIMAEKGLELTGEGWDLYLARAIVDAVDEKRARNISRCIINLSWGASSTSMLIHDAIKYAYDYGVLIIGAAGNEGTDAKHYPAAYDEVVAVTATNRSDMLCEFSSFGDWVEVAAPGNAIYSTYPRDSYTYMSGTSMSAAYATGVAALIWSQFPRMTRDQVRAQLRYTAEDLGEPGFDDLYGFGRVDARRAVETDQAEHDLVVMGWQKPPYAKVGEWMTINTTILNLGKRDENDATVQVLVNNEIVSFNRTGLIKNGTSITVSCQAKLEVDVPRKTYNITSYLLPVVGETAKKENVDQYASDDEFWITIPMTIEVGPSGHYASIQKAVNGSFPEDTIHVASGTYFEHVTIDKPSLTLYAESGAVIDGNGTSYPVIEVMESNTLIQGFIIEHGDCGISLEGGGNNMIVGNTMINNSRGITLKYSSGNLLSANSLVNNYENFVLFASDLGEFVQYIDPLNKVNGKPIYYLRNQQNMSVPPDAGCVVVVNSTNITVKDLTLENNGAGVIVAYAKDCTVANLNVTGNHNYGILVFASNDTVIRNNAIGAASSVGVEILHSFNCTAKDNMIRNPFTGINLGHSFTCTISNNTVCCSGVTTQYGVWLSSAANSIVTGNTVLNSSNGMSLTQSGQSILRNNSVIGSAYSFGIYGYDLPGFLLDIDTSNTIDGKPIRYLTNQKDLTIDPTEFANMGYIGIVNSSDITVKNIGLTGNGQGIMFAHTANIIMENVTASENVNGIYASSSRDLTISNCSITDNVYGIWLSYSSGCTLNNIQLVNNTDSVYADSCVSSTFSDNSLVDQSYGFWLGYSFNCNVTNNKITGFDTGCLLENCTSIRLENNAMKGTAWAVGILMYLSGNNLVSGNNVVHCLGGLAMDSSSFNTLVDNTFYENRAYALALFYSYNNTIYHNNLINPQVNNLIMGNWQLGDNNWDNGRQEGNYWSDYKGLDDGSGGGVKGDGVGDTDLPHSAQCPCDYYPLMGAYLTGDVNHDGKVNILDVSKVAAAWQTSIGRLEWNIHADLDSNDIINIVDVTLAAKNFGKTWTPPI